MGYFSFMYADKRNSAMKIDGQGYMLVPEEFREQYGAYIFEDCYNGYGRIGAYDIYELLALWNKAYINDSVIESIKKPVFEEYGGLYAFQKEDMKKSGISDEEIEKKDLEIKNQYFEKAVKQYQDTVQSLRNFNSSGIEYSREKLREIGIVLFFEAGNKVKYPLKITSKPMIYEEVAKCSVDDPEQGF